MTALRLLSDENVAEAFLPRSSRPFRIRITYASRRRSRIGRCGLEHGSRLTGSRMPSVTPTPLPGRHALPGVADDEREPWTRGPLRRDRVKRGHEPCTEALPRIVEEETDIGGSWTPDLS